MKGTCQVCGCMPERACVQPDGQPCGWIDALEDLCTVCAFELASGSNPPTAETSAAELALHVRALGALLRGVQQMNAVHHHGLVAVLETLGMAERGDTEIVQPDKRLWVPGT